MCLVCLDEEVIQDENDDNICSIYFLVGLNDKNENRQGHFDVANVLNLISERFLKKRLIADRFRIQFPVSKKFQEDDTWPKFFGGMTTLWTVNKPMIEETEYDYKKVMYMGPTLRGVARNGSVFENGLPANLSKLAEKKPIIKNLIVPLAETVETKKAIDTEGTAEAVAYDKIAAISRSEIENILKGE